MSVGRDLVSRVTDAVMEDVAEWQQGPLEDWRESWEYVIPFWRSLRRSAGAVHSQLCARLGSCDSPQNG
jgi:hypothetical protein